MIDIVVQYFVHNFDKFDKKSDTHLIYHPLDIFEMKVVIKYKYNMGIITSVIALEIAYTGLQ